MLHVQPFRSAAGGGGGRGPRDRRDRPRGRPRPAPSRAAPSRRRGAPRGGAGPAAAAVPLPCGSRRAAPPEPKPRPGRAGHPRSPVWPARGGSRDRRHRELSRAVPQVSPAAALALPKMFAAEPSRSRRDRRSPGARYASPLAQRCPPCPSPALPTRVFRRALRHEQRTRFCSLPLQKQWVTTVHAAKPGFTLHFCTVRAERAPLGFAVAKEPEKFFPLQHRGDRVGNQQAPAPSPGSAQHPAVP